MNLEERYVTEITTTVTTTYRDESSFQDPVIISITMINGRTSVE